MQLMDLAPFSSWNNLDSASSADRTSQTNEARVVVKDSSNKKYLGKYG